MCLRIENLMPHGLYKWDPLTSEERDEYENDLISFCDRELDLLGDIEGLDVLYAGGSSLLWIEGLSQRIGEKGSLNAWTPTSNASKRAASYSGRPTSPPRSNSSRETSSGLPSHKTPSA
ncbi:MAG TPA: hypothetical protein VK359_07270 [Rubrobacteraceae bacterium]|nr:hypothetical protein [Rubrobacteraceae bacterium]